jgi:hypothetical protein
MKKGQAGVGLLEVILVLAIGSALIFISVQQYLNYKVNADAMQIKEKTDALLQAMSFFYKAECYGSVDSSGNLVPGDLHPSSISNFDTSPPESVGINISTQLMTPGYLNESLIINNPLINKVGASGYNGFVAQFNLTTPLPNRLICTSGSTPGSPPGVNCASSQSIGKVVIWRSQVAVRMKDTANAARYRDLLGADCLSSDAGGGLVKPCSTSGNTGSYIVWEKISSTPNPKALSNYLFTTPTVAQFTQIYRTQSAYSVLNSTSTTTQYFVCVN